MQHIKLITATTRKQSTSKIEKKNPERQVCCLLMQLDVVGVHGSARVCGLSCPLYSLSYSSSQLIVNAKTDKFFTNHRKLSLSNDQKQSMIKSL